MHPRGNMVEYPILAKQVDVVHLLDLPAPQTLYTAR